MHKLSEAHCCVAQSADESSHYLSECFTPNELFDVKAKKRKGLGKLKPLLLLL